MSADWSDVSADWCAPLDLPVTGTQRLRIELPSSEWLTSNQRLDRHEHARRVAAIRRRAALLARAHLVPVAGCVYVVAQARFRGGRGIDDDNIQPAVKAIKDGLTDAGVWADDAGQFVGGTAYTASRRDGTLRKGWHAIELTIVDQEVPW